MNLLITEQNNYKNVPLERKEPVAEMVRFMCTVFNEGQPTSREDLLKLFRKFERAFQNFENVLFVNEFKKHMKINMEMWVSYNNFRKLNFQRN